MANYLETDATARAIYRDHVSVHSMLYWQWHRTAQDTQQGTIADQSVNGSDDLPRSAFRPPGAPYLSSPTTAEPANSSWYSPRFLAAPLQNAFGYVSSGWPIAYLVATVVVWPWNYHRGHYAGIATFADGSPVRYGALCRRAASYGRRAYYRHGGLCVGRRPSEEFLRNHPSEIGSFRSVIVLLSGRDCWRSLTPVERR